MHGTGLQQTFREMHLMTKLMKVPVFYLRLAFPRCLRILFDFLLTALTVFLLFHMYLDQGCTPKQRVYSKNIMLASAKSFKLLFGNDKIRTTQRYHAIFEQHLLGISLRLMLV